MRANFEPDRKIVTAITKAAQGIVTAASHGYTTADIIRVNIPVNYGMSIPRDEFEITIIDADTFSIDEDTSALDPFVVPSVSPLTVAECLPISHEIENIA